MKKNDDQPGSLNKPQNNSFLCKQIYTWSFGPHDHCDRLPEFFTQQQRPKGNRLGIRDKGTSRKRGYQSGFTVIKLYLWPDVTQISTRCCKHTDLGDNLLHGSCIAGQPVKHNYAPPASNQIKDWVSTQLLDGHSSQQIMAKHARSALPKIQNRTADRDCFLDSQTIRNIDAKHAKLTWKRHVKQAQSVRFFYREHSEHIFIYQKQRSSQPQQSAIQHSAKNDQPASSAEYQ